MSLIMPQVDFLEDMCFNRTENVNVFNELKQTLEECQSMILNGTNLTLTYDTLVYKDPREFYDFYTSWVITKINQNLWIQTKFASAFDDDLHLSLLCRQCTEQSAIDLRDECNDNLKYLLKQCLNETELLAFNKIEDIAVKIYQVICDMDQEKMKRNYELKLGLFRGYVKQFLEFVILLGFAVSLKLKTITKKKEYWKSRESTDYANRFTTK